MKGYKVNLREEIVRQVVPAGSVTIWWLGQAGFCVKSPGGKTVVIDPYLSNSCKSLGEQLGFDMGRLLPPPLAPAELAGFDLYAITHSHGDHLDPESLAGYRAAGGRGPYLAPCGAVRKLQELGVARQEILMTWPSKAYTFDDLTVGATFAIPFGGDDLTHVGYLASIDQGPTVYFTGDTAYHEVMARSIAEHRPDVMVTVINGTFYSLGPAEAAQLAKQLDVKIVIPCHYDIFPCNALSPQVLQTNLQMLGIGDRYRVLEHGKAFTFPESPK
jgi:L-ascorbate 6-phosphate lactonase